MSDSDAPAVVIDNGSHSIKAGLAGDDEPSVVFPTLVGRLLDEDPKFEGDHGDRCVGEEAWAKRGMMSVKAPVEYGMVTDWDGMESVWYHVFHNELRVDPENQPVLVTDAPLNPKQNRERTVQILFDTLKAPAVSVANQAVLDLYAFGRSTGLVVESGEGFTYAVPVYEGYVLADNIRRFDYSGRHLTEYLAKLLAERGHSFNADAQREVVPDVKEKACYTALDFDQEMKRGAAAVEESFDLPDGQSITVGNERFRCPEALFRPSLFGDGCGDGDGGIHKTAFEAVMKCEVDIRKDLFANVLLAGGSTLFPGLEARLEKELVALAPPAAKVKVVAPPDRKNATWIGGSVMAALSSFQDRWIKRSEYDEHGPSIVHSKCF